MDDEPEKELDEHLIANVLTQLAEITHQIQAEDIFKNEIARQLRNHGYDDCFGEEQEQENDIDADHVVKVLAIAITNTMKRKVDIASTDKDADEDESDNTDAYEEKLETLLDINEGKSMDDYLTKGWTDTLPTATSPLDLAKHVKKSAPLRFIKNLLQRQFEVKWATRTGLPRDFTYYEFCEEEGTIKHLKYKPRKAQVKVQLYNECMKRSPRELTLTEEQLCPTVYMKTTDGWRTWEATSGKFEAVKSNQVFKWMNESIRNFILDNADEMKGDGDGNQSRNESSAMEKCLEKPALYWAIVQDEFNAGGKSQLKETGKSQVFVGTAENGVRGGWIDDSGSHCAMMKKCVDNVRAMTIYDPLRLKGIQLVDVRFALAKIRADKCALFLMETFGDDEHKAAITREKTNAACAEANTELKKAKRAHQEMMKKLSETEQSRQADRSKELRRAHKAAERSKDVLKNASEMVTNAQQMVADAEAVLDETRGREQVDLEVKTKLKNAEARHKDGKRSGNTNTNIISYDSDGNRLLWKPKNMAFGMNDF